MPTVPAGDPMNTSPRFKARLAGVLYLISGVPAGFSVYVIRKLVVRGDPAATAANILGSETMFRLGFVADLVGIILVLASMLLVYELFKTVNRTRALLVTLLFVIGSAHQALDSLTDLTALILLKGGGGLAALTTAQAQALAQVFLRLHALVYDIALVFYGAGFIVLSTIVLQATFVPRLIGVPLAIDGLGYVTFSFATFLASPLAAHLYPYVPFVTAFLGEGALMFWLLIKGVDAQRWQEQASYSAGTRLVAR